MTHRSPKHHQPKTTTISRRIRDRVDQNLSVQPPEIPQIRAVRARRAATLPTPRHNPIDYQTSDSHPPSLAWDTPHNIEGLLHSSTSQIPDPAEGQFSHPLLAQSFDTSPRQSSRGSTSITQQTSRDHQVQPTLAPTFLPSPLPSVSGSQDFELQFSADPGQSHNSFLELQDMRYVGQATMGNDTILLDQHLGFHDGSFAVRYEPLRLSPDFLFIRLPAPLIVCGIKILSFGPLCLILLDKSGTKREPSKETRSTHHITTIPASTAFTSQESLPTAATY